MTTTSSNDLEPVQAPAPREWKTVAGVPVEHSTVEEVAKRWGVPVSVFEPKETGIPNHCAEVVG